MIRKINILYLVIFFIYFASCNSNSQQNSIVGSSSTRSSELKVDYEKTNDSHANYYQSSRLNNSDDELEEDNSDNSSICGLEDGTHSATVDYSNSETGYSATYTLDIEIQECQVVQINFPNGGYLDEDHISYAEIDEDGHASVDGEDGKSYDIYIDK